MPAQRGLALAVQLRAPHYRARASAAGTDGLDSSRWARLSGRIASELRPSWSSVYPRL